MILLCSGCQFKVQSQPADYSSADILSEEIINDYLIENIGITGFGGEVFCAHELMDAQPGKDGVIYVWALCQEYYLMQGSATDGSGISLPVALQTQQNGNKVEIIGFLIPRDGSYYGPDVREIFPKRTWPQIMPQNEDEINQYNSRAKKLMEETRIKAHLGD